MVKTHFTEDEVKQAVDTVPDGWGWHILAMLDSDPRRGFKVHDSQAKPLVKAGVVASIQSSGRTPEPLHGPWYAITKLGHEAARFVGLQLIKVTEPGQIQPTKIEWVKCGICSGCHRYLYAEHWKGYNTGQTWWSVVCQVCQLQGHGETPTEAMEVLNKAVQDNPPASTNLCEVCGMDALSHKYMEAEDSSFHKYIDMNPAKVLQNTYRRTGISTVLVDDLEGHEMEPGKRDKIKAMADGLIETLKPWYWTCPKCEAVHDDSGIRTVSGEAIYATGSGGWFRSHGKWFHIHPNRDFEGKPSIHNKESCQVSTEGIPDVENGGNDD